MGTSRTIIVQKAIVKDGDTYLILLRAADESFFASKWDFPGGRLEPGEDPKAGIEREVLEETGLRVEATEIVGRYAATEQGYDIHFTSYDVRVPEDKTVVIGEEHSEYRWATEEEICALGEANLMPHIPEYFRRLHLP